MDMYRILENFDAVNSKRTLTEGRMSMSAIDELYQEWVNSEDAPFDSDSGDQNAVLEKAMRFLNGRVRPEQIEDIADMLANHWHGGQGVMGEERRTDADWDAAAISAGKRGRDARDNPSRHAARAKAGQAMRGNAKPDFLDLDRDGDKTEPMKSAAKGVAEGMLTHRDFEKPDDVDVQKMAKMAAKGLLTYATKTKMNPANLLKKDYYALAAMLEKVNPNLYAAIDDQLSDNDYNWLYFKAADLAANAAAKQGVAEAGKAPFPGTPEYELRFGKDDASSAFDKKKISTGTVYSRKHFDEPEAGDDDAPRAAGRPKGTGRRLGAKGPSVASKLLKGKGGLKEYEMEHDHMNGLDRDEYDQEGEMARQDLHTMVDAARELHAILGSDENLPEWVQSKITKALDYIDTARDYMQSVDAERSDQPMAEIAPVIGAMAGRALAGAAGAGSVGQALGGLAGRAVAGAMNSGDDEVAEASPPGEFKPGSHVLLGGRMPAIVKSVSGNTAIVYDPMNPKAPFHIETSKLQLAPAGHRAFKFEPVAAPASEASAAPFEIGDKVIWRQPSGMRVRGVFKGMKDGVAALIYSHPYTHAIPLSRVQPDRGENDGDLYDPKLPNPTMEEADVEEVGYSAKSARAGKDIGKPGKNFGKIAKGAAERYGSKAAGERVAGAVLNKLRHPTKEGTGDLRSSVLSVIQHIYDGATAGEEMVDDVASELGQYFSQVKKCTDKPLRKAYQMMSREGAEAEGDPEYMAQVAQKAIDLLSQPAVDEGSADKKDPPFAPDTKSSFKKSTNPNRTNRDSVKALAQKGLADMTTAELKAELKRRSRVEEESTDTRDQHAEKAGKKVTRDIEHDEGHKGRDDDKAEKAGKKVAKDIEYDDKKDKKKEVEETTVSGSVAPAAGGDAPKKGKGGMQFGQGVYEGQLDELDKSTLGSYVKKATKDVDDKSRETQQYKDMFAGDYPVRGAKKAVQQKQADIDKRVGGIGKAVDRLTKEGVYEGQVAESFEKKLKNVLNEGMSVNVSTDDTGKKSISVNATDSDADALGDMLKMAGLFSSEGYSSVCQGCGGIHEAGACGADMVEEELANSPDEVYTDVDYMTQTLSGGLNGPKTTGQTTGDVVNRQDSRQGVMAEAGTVIPLRPDLDIELRRAADQGFRDGYKGINNNPYLNNSPAGRAYRQGQESFERQVGKPARDDWNAGRAPLYAKQGDVKEVAERVKTQAESRLWNLYKKI